MKNIYLLLSTVLILNACSDKKEPTLEEILATNNVDQITSEKIKIDAALQELTLNLNKSWHCANVSDISWHRTILGQFLSTQRCRIHFWRALCNSANLLFGF